MNEASARQFHDRFRQVRTSERPLYDVYLRDAYMSQEYRDLVRTMQTKKQQLEYMKVVNDLSGAYFRSRYRDLETADMLHYYEREVEAFTKTAPKGTLQMNQIAQRYQCANGTIKFSPSREYKTVLRQQIAKTRSQLPPRTLLIYD